MIIRFFKQNYISQYLLFTILAIVLWIPSFTEPPYIAAQDASGPLYNLLIGFTTHKLIWIIFAFACLYIQSFLLNGILIYHEIIPKTSFLGGFLFFILSSSLIEFQYFHPALIGQFFIIISIHNLNKMYGKDYFMPDTFKTGFLIGLASLFYFPFIIYLLLIWASLLLFRVSRIRPWIVPVFSFATPYLFLFTYYFWFDKLYIFEGYVKQLQLNFQNIWLLKSELSIYQSLAYVFLFLISYLFLFGKISENSIIVRKKIYMISNMFLISILGFFFFNESLNEFIGFIIPFSAIIAIYFNSLKKLFWINLFFSLLLLCTYFNAYNHAFHWI